MAFVAAIIAVEKIVPWLRGIVTYATAAVLLVLGILLLAAPDALPALTIPAGFAASGLPIGMQLIGRPFRDETLIALGEAFQGATDYHTRAPALP